MVVSEAPEVPTDRLPFSACLLPSPLTHSAPALGPASCFSTPLGLVLSWGLHSGQLPILECYLPRNVG